MQLINSNNSFESKNRKKKQKNKSSKKASDNETYLHITCHKQNTCTGYTYRQICTFYT